MLPESLVLLMEHCGQPLTLKRGRATWEGETEITSERYVCGSCGLLVTIEAREHVGPPGGDS